jgi:Tfp pilus assembly protein PilN
MADIDMIPREYRDGVRVRRTLRLAGIALAAVVAVGALGGIGLRWRTAALERAVGALQASAAQAQTDSARGAQQQAEQARREQDHAVLRTLRRQGELAALARGLDASLSDAVWLTELRIERDVQAVSPAGGAAASAPAADEGIEEFSASAAAGAAALQTWRMRSSVEIGGQAANYGAVTAFLSALGRQPGIAGLHLVSSSAAQDGGAIDFRATGSLLQKGTNK